MNDLNNQTTNEPTVEPTTIGELIEQDEARKAGVSVDDYLRQQVDQYRNKLRIAEIDLDISRKTEDEQRERTRAMTAGLMALIEPEIVAMFESMLYDHTNDIIQSADFESAVEDALDTKLDRYLDADDIDERISDSFGDSNFDTCVRDVVKEMIRDGEITISVENIELSLDS